MPSQPQNRARKVMRGSRRLTTISFESLERINRGVFTEDISSSSRIARPSFVLRQGTVVASNMPETIKLANHRGKIYVGLSETTSDCSSQKDSRCLSRDRSAATTIGKASIIDWADSASDVSSRVPLSGELTSMLPPVQKPQQQKHQPSPGLDMTEILNYKTTKYVSSSNSSGRRQGQRSPKQSPPRGGGTKLLGGFRPPQNTPFTLPSRPDDFSASFRKKVIPRSPRDNVNVMILGGGITPVPATRQDTQRSLLSRESTMTDRRRLRKNPQSVASLGSANFDLPMIDLKCVESPVGTLGNLEEKGIRLVKLRRVKRTKKRSESQSSDGRGGGSSATTPSDGKRNSLKEETGRDPLCRSNTYIPRPPPSSREITMNKTPGGDTLELETTISEKCSEGNVLLSPRSITSSALSEARPPIDGKRSQSDVGSNHDHYSTPLLPNTGRSTSRSDKQKPASSPVIQINSEPIKDDIPVFQMTVEKPDATPDIPLPVMTVVEEYDITPSFPGRRGKRSSSLLSVPTSDLSESRPGGGEESERRDMLSPVRPEPEEMDNLQSRTIATQTWSSEQ